MSFSSLFGRNGINRAADDNEPEMLQQQGGSSATGTIRPNHAAILDQARRNAATGSDPNAPNAGRITLFQNGFLIGEESEGDFYPTVVGPPANADNALVQENMRHLADIQRGFVPQFIEARIRQRLGDQLQ